MTLAADTFAYVADLVRQRSAISLEPGKEYLVESRLAPLARERGMDVDAYVRALRAQPRESELMGVVEALTTNETSWFRDQTPFVALSQHVVPALRAHLGRLDSLRVWSAACSTGQEPYSIAMVLDGTLDAGTALSITATDLSEQVLARARAGTYTQLEINRGLPAPMLVRHFQRAGAHWQVSDPLRKVITFRRHNLLDPAPAGGPFDVVFLRNVLIYFDLAVKRAVLDRVLRAMRPGGYLVLGAAETTLGVHDGFERVEAGRACLHRAIGRPLGATLPTDTARRLAGTIPHPLSAADRTRAAVPTFRGVAP